MFPREKKTFTKEEDAALVIQKHYRSHVVRKKYKLKQIPGREQAPYKAFVVGNAPVIYGLQKYKSSNKIALVSLSGMRALSIACELSDLQSIPKIILVDNSWHVIQFWKKMQAFMNVQKSEKDFFSNLKKFLQDNDSLYRDMRGFENIELPGVKYLDQNIKKYFANLFAKYGFKMIKDIILHASIIAQSWVNTTVFENIKNISEVLNIHDIYVYASDVVSLVEENERDQVLKNISCLNPILSIHHDCCEFHKIPEKVFLLTNQDPDFVKKTIMQQDKEAYWLHIAAQNGYTDLVDDLLEDEDLNQPNDRGETPLMLAAQYDHVEVVIKLLNEGASLDMTDNEGLSVFDRVAINNDRATMTSLAKFKFDQLEHEEKLLLNINAREQVINSLKEIQQCAKDLTRFSKSLATLIELDRLAKKLGFQYIEEINSAYECLAANPFNETVINGLKTIESKLKQSSSFLGFSFSFLSRRQASQTVPPTQMGLFPPKKNKGKEKGEDEMEEKKEKKDLKSRI